MPHQLTKKPLKNSRANKVWSAGRLSNQLKELFKRIHPVKQLIGLYGLLMFIAAEETWRHAIPYSDLIHSVNTVTLLVAASNVIISPNLL
jgi:hypothetical protein